MAEGEHAAPKEPGSRPRPVTPSVPASRDLGVRIEDLTARYGGEELALLVRVDSMDAARVFAQRIRRYIDALRIAFGERTLRVTGSIGVAELSECSAVGGLQELIGLADLRLYRAKFLGRNRVCLG